MILRFEQERHLPAKYGNGGARKLLETEALDWVAVETVLEQAPFSGHVFVFRGKRGDLIKVLWFDGDGLCLFQKRLERGRFVWPQLFLIGASARARLGEKHAARHTRDRQRQKESRDVQSSHVQTSGSIPQLIFSSKDDGRAHGRDPMRPSSNHVFQQQCVPLHAAPRVVW